MAKGDDIENRLVDFAVRVIRLCDSLPRTRSAEHIARQLLRSGTAPAAHYAEARGAESMKDFIHKLRLTLKELNESRIWIRLMIRSKLIPENRLKDLYSSCDQLCRIVNASIKTARNRL